MVGVRVPRSIKDLIDMTTRELDEMGIPWELEFCGKHSRLIYTVRGKTIVTTISKSASDRRASLNLRSLVRSSIRQMESNT